MSKDKEKGKAALKAITKARTVLIVSNPFYGCLALHLQPVEVSNPAFCSTMAVDGKHLFYWPDFVLDTIKDTQGEQKLVGVVALEVSHCAYQHMTRRGHRNPKKWNYAGDYVINEDIMAAGFLLPEKRLHDPQFKGMSTEEVYERIPDPPTIKIKIKMKGGSGDEDSQGGSQGGGPGDIEIEIEITDPTGCGGVLDAPGEDKGEEAESAGIGHEWEVLVRQALQVARAQNAGRVPGHLERLVTQLQKPRINWRDQTKEFVDGAMIKDYSWAHPNRRHLGRGLILPGWYNDSMHHLVAVVDISGSISDDMARAMVSEVAGALDEGITDKLTVLYADTHVRQVDEWLPGDMVTARTMGGGGTAFRNSFEWIKENAADASCVIYLTDCETSDWGDEPHCPTLWATYNSHQRYENLIGSIPFGHPVFVESPYE